MKNPARSLSRPSPKRLLLAAACLAALFTACSPNDTNALMLLYPQTAHDYGNP